MPAVVLHAVYIHETSKSSLSSLTELFLQQRGAETSLGSVSPALVSSVFLFHYAVLVSTSCFCLPVLFLVRVRLVSPGCFFSAFLNLLVLVSTFFCLDFPNRRKFGLTGSKVT